jgi:hypothetical protein
MVAGMNSGVWLLRNTDWSRDILAQMAAYGTQPMDIAKEEVRMCIPFTMMGWVFSCSAKMCTAFSLMAIGVPVQHLRANLPSYEVGLYEQNVLTYLFYTKPELMDMVVFDISRYGLNCWYALTF